MEISGIGRGVNTSGSAIADAVVSVAKSPGLDGLKGMVDVTCNGETRTTTVEELQETVQGKMTELSKQMQGVNGAMEALKGAMEKAIQDIR